MPRRGELAVRRRTVGLSQEALAERLGVERSTVARWESGRTCPQPWTRRALARELDLDLDQLAVLIEGRDVPGADASVLGPGPVQEIPERHAGRVADVRHLGDA